MMKRFLMILVLGLLFISIGLSNPTRVEADTKERLLKSMEEHAKTLPKKGWFEKQWDKLPDLPNPGRYLEKKKNVKKRLIGQIPFMMVNEDINVAWIIRKQ